MPASLPSRSRACEGASSFSLAAPRVLSPGFDESLTTCIRREDSVREKPASRRLRASPAEPADGHPSLSLSEEERERRETARHPGQDRYPTVTVFGGRAGSRQLQCQGATFSFASPGPPFPSSSPIVASNNRETGRTCTNGLYR